MSCGLVRIAPLHAGSSYGFRPTKYSSLKNPIGSVPSSGRPSSLATVVTCGKLSRMPRTCGAELRRLVERDRVGHRRAHPERAFVEVRHELGADERHEQQRRAEDRAGTTATVAARWRRQTSSSRPYRPRDALVERHARLLDVLAQEDRRRAPAAASASRAASRPARTPSCRPSAGTAGPTARSARRSAGSPAMITAMA